MTLKEMSEGVALLQQELSVVVEERDRLKAALELVYGAFIEQGLDSSYTYADDAARSALSGDAK